MNQLVEGAKGERKTLERHRKYIIAILLAYTNGFEIIRGQPYGQKISYNPNEDTNYDNKD